MAQPGTYTAYRQLRPLEGDVSQDIQQQEENGFRRRALDQVDQRTQNDKADKEATRAEARKKADRELLKQPTFKPTGVQTIDTLNAGALRKVVNRQFEAHTLLNDPKISESEKDMVRLELSNLEKAPENLLLTQNTFKEWFENYDKGVAAGTIHRDPAMEEKRKSGFDAFTVTFDKQGNPLVGFGEDNDGDGEMDVVPFENIKNKMVLGVFKPKIDLENITTNLAKEVGTMDITDDKGNYISTQTKKVDDSKLKTAVNNIVFDGDNNPSIATKSQLTTWGLPETPENINKVKDYVYSQTLSKTDYLHKQSFDSGDQNADQSRAQSERHFNITRADKKKGKPQDKLTSENVTKVGTVKGNQEIEGTSIKGAHGANVYSLSGINLERPIGKKGAYETVQNIYVKPGSNEIIFDVIKTDGTIFDKDSGVKESNTTKLSYSSNKQSQMMGDFVRKYKNSKGEYYKNISEFAEEVMGIPQKKSKQAINSITAGYTEGGYRFKGGNANDPKNWEKL